MRPTGGRGVDVAIEVVQPWRLGDLRIPLGAFAAGLGDHSIVTSLCPGGSERMRRLISVIKTGRVDLGAMVTHRFKLDQIEAAYGLFAHQRDGVFKVAITP
jgi:alcohol dehydrogenase